MKTAQPTVQSTRLKYIAGLDGLRAVAVTAVFLFHAGVVSGGFIGVDVFFVISGFLITALAIGEIERTGRLSLGAFWARRARRLLPALFAVVAAVVAFSVWEGGAALRRVGTDAFATIAYVANWSQIGEGRDYFAAYDADPLLEHAWSLAVEEQFYLVWPLALVVITGVARRFGAGLRSVVAAVSVAGALCSFAAAIWLKSKSGTSLSRLYYGTDTRAVGLGVGAFLGAVIGPAQISRLSRPSPLRDLAAVCSLGVLGWMTVTLDGTEKWLYGPGFLLVACLSAVVLIATIGAGRLARVLSVDAAAGLGRVSYGAYLWQWPVIVVLDAERTGLEGISLGVLWLAATAVLTMLSWWLIERPAPLPTIRHPRRLVAYLAAAVLVTTGAAVAAETAIEAQRNAPFAMPEAPDAATTNISTPPPSATPSSATPSSATPSSATPSSATPSTTSTVLDVASNLVMPVDRNLRLLLVGDSVAHSLSAGGARRASYDVVGYGSVDVFNIGEIGCPVIQDGGWYFADGTVLADSDACDGVARFDDEIAEFGPDLIVGLFGWPGIGGGQKFSDGTIAWPCERRFDASWLGDYQAMIDRLATDDRPFIAATVAPFAAPADDGYRATRCINALVRQLTAPVFDYQEWLCPDYDCTTSASLRYDGLHFRDSEPLQREVIGGILTQVLPISGWIRQE